MNIFKFSIRFIRRLILLFIILLLLNIVFIVLFASSQPLHQSSETLTDNITKEINLNRSSPSLSSKGKRMIRQNHLWVIVIDSNSGKLEYSYKKPAAIPNQYNLTDVAKFSRFYLEDYPVFNQSIQNHMIIVGFPKNIVIRFSANYLEKQDFRFYSFLIFGLLIFNILYFVILYTSSISVVSSKLKQFSKAIQNLPKGNNSYNIKYPDEFTPLIKAIKNADKQLEENARFKKNWLDGIAHDIRTPLSVIISNADLAKNEKPSPSISKRMNIILVETYYIQNVLNDLNIFERISEQEFQIQAETTEIIPFFKKIIIKFINQQIWDNFTFSFNYDDDVVGKTIFIENNLISRVIHNIIYNTILHNPNGCNIDVYLKIINEKLSLSICDDGIGVAKDRLIALNKNEDYSKIGISSTNRHGIGLKISKQIVELHEGTVLFESVEKKYFKTTILLPIFLRS